MGLGAADGVLAASIYRVGRDWRVERAQLLDWLEKQSNRRARPKAECELEPFFGPDGRLKALPAQRRKRDAVLARLAAEFEPDRTYPEREVNATLRRFHDDVATIRRELIMAKLLVRTRNGIYKRVAPHEPALRRG